MTGRETGPVEFAILVAKNAPGSADGKRDLQLRTAENAFNGIQITASIAELNRYDYYR